MFNLMNINFIWIGSPKYWYSLLIFPIGIPYWYSLLLYLLVIKSIGRLRYSPYCPYGSPCSLLKGQEQLMSEATSSKVLEPFIKHR